MKKYIIGAISIVFVAVAGIFAAIKFKQDEKAGISEFIPENLQNIIEKGGDNRVDVFPAGEPYRSTEDISQDKFSFAVLGDTQRFSAGNKNGPFQIAVNNIRRADVDLVFAMGDLVSSCDGGKDCVKKFQNWKAVMGNLLPKTYQAQGNHDRTGGSKADKAWRDVFDLPMNGPDDFKEIVYSFDSGNSHFVILASDNPKEHAVNKAQGDWLEQDLSQNKKENTFVFFHEPAFPVSSKIKESLDENSGERDVLWKILDAHNVTTVFSGHEHINSRRKIDALIFPGATNVIYQLGIGNTDSFSHDAPKPGVAEYSYVGYHYAIVDVEGKKITINIYSVDGNLLDTFSLEDF